MIFTWFLARKKGFPRYPRATHKEIAVAIYRGSPAVLFPVIIVVGIMSGVFTPTEAAAVAVLYGLFLGMVVYRNVGLREFWHTMLNVVWGSVRILIIVAAASCFSWIMLREQVPQVIASALFAITDRPIIVLFLLSGFLLLVGLFMVASSAEVVLAPLLVPVVVEFGIDPVHFGVLMVFVLIVGGGTPPVGVLLYIAQDIAEVPFGDVVKAMVPYYVPLAIAIVLIIFFPQISLWIPNMVFGPGG
jgi:tripartite ATP-independent transporter DctM subunit